MKLHLLWTVLWPLGFNAYFSIHKFYQNYVRNAIFLQFLTTLCAQLREQQSFIVFAFFSSGEGSYYVEFKFLSWSCREIWSVAGRTKEWGKKNPRNPTQETLICSVLTCAFDARKNWWKREWIIQKFWGDLYPTTPSLYTIRFTYIAIDLPEENSKWTPL